MMLRRLIETSQLTVPTVQQSVPLNMYNSVKSYASRNISGEAPYVVRTEKFKDEILNLKKK